ncbi:DEAD/DEAH box helicase [Nitratireductor sp. L1-7-SE]|uniref:DEAD/DEAH box helicase n=1 Tax=Nitratireductor rhodophyticola TaxID=2854036 RepID=A0ABS7R5B2_9HYPH|nr:DEAD/DEAH box helicase [Nitratireductor rhodophyticola]MBY8916108.1 DEAD/DEAH box helicase [Nitratireductor rhodophyticola]MBY8921471.1 DEAD/DEAH box helicase [Nitratireductor rhodophyticola]
MTEFEGIVPALGRALDKRGYTELTQVQKAVLELEPAGADALVSAQTGSGKTVAFGIALAPSLLDGAESFDRAAAPLGLAVAPTRELALQVKRELEWLYAETGAVIASCVGGMDIRTERRALERGAHIVVGTPGRLCDHIRRNALDMSDLRAVVLDEADEMLDLGFREDLEFILDAAPAERRTLMFSATVSRTIANLAKNYQRDAVRITTAAEQKQHGDIEYRGFLAIPQERENAIINVLRYHEARNALVFCNTRATVNHLTARFNNRGFSVVALSGELSQSERTHALQAMRDGRARVCVATDVAARGIDLPNLELVVHADLPTNAETLLHRSGRTGRAGRKGVSALIVAPNGRRRAERLLRDAKVRLEWTSPPSADEVLQRDDERLMADPHLEDPIQENEADFVKALLEKHGAEQIAAAFVRLHRAKLSAPEDVTEVTIQDGGGMREERAPRREEFDESVWFSLSVGRKQNAEPRWLIPLLCRAGDITKREIGAIKMQQDETFVQLDAACVDRFLAAIGPQAVLERSIRVVQLDGAPEFAARGSGPKPFAGKRRPAGKPHRKGGEWRDDAKPWAKKDGKPGKPKFAKPAGGKKKARKKPD